MEEKQVLTTPLNESELSKVSAGAVGAVGVVTQIRAASGGLYKCPNTYCGGTDFTILEKSDALVKVRCMKCNTTFYLSEV